MESIASTSVFLPRTLLHSAWAVAPQSNCQISIASSSFKRCFHGSRGLGKLGLANRGAHRFPVTCFAANDGGSFVTEISELQFSDTVLKSDRPVLVEFVATWCGPCRLISAIVESIGKEYKDRVTFVKIDHDANPKLIEEYKVYGLPTLILFKDGREVPGSRREGAIAKAKLKEYLDSLLESATVA